ncbi:hypothetical protein [Kosakonia cowanii]|uniref:hypothetical protein n=1 Tax=Kosakonia cowanii TaxID=208223 RepID=UPI00289B7F9E|nr:hypothetical protein [Kosakonia cowanii]
MQRFSYNDEHRISRVENDGDAEYTRAEYRYDALGRRTEKQVWHRHPRKTGTHAVRLILPADGGRNQRQSPGRGGAVYLHRKQL